MYDTRRGANPAAIDLRSDTVTTPSVGMRAAMAAAEVGDDVYGEDPTVNRLEAELAERLGKEAAMYCSSGTQSNLCGVWSHCNRGDEYIIGDAYHVFRYEAGGTAVLASTMPFPIATQADGSLRAADVAGAIKANDQHFPPSRLLCLENTHNGKAQTPDMMAEPIAVARANGMGVHLDGARVFNASVALGIDIAKLVEPFDTVSICLSKGLGAPIGSVLVGPAEHIAKARRARKLLGGAMRQAGILAEAGRYALANHVDGLADDHRRAEALAAALDAHPDMDTGGGANTNMIFVHMDIEVAERFAAAMADVGANVGVPATTMRLVLHRDITDEHLETLIGAIGTVA
jgi:threonine aldolase